MSLRNDPNQLQSVLIDMDGTLVDHFQALYRCYRYASEQLGNEPPSHELVKRSVGGSMPVTIRKFFPEEQVEEAIRLWSEHFDEIHLEDVILLRGAKELLDVLQRREIKTAVFTNKSGEHTRNICRNLGLEDYFEFALGAGDTPYRKPQRELSELALQRLGTKAENTILVGDSPFDIEAASIVNMTSFCVPTGSHTREELAEAGADRIFDSLQEIADWIESCSKSS